MAFLIKGIWNPKGDPHLSRLVSSGPAWSGNTDEMTL